MKIVELITQILENEWSSWWLREEKDIQHFTPNTWWICSISFQTTSYFGNQMQITLNNLLAADFFELYARSIQRTNKAKAQLGPWSTFRFRRYQKICPLQLT